MQRSPALVAAEDAADITHDRCIAGRDHEAPQQRRHHRLPSRQDRPERERHQADGPDHTEWPAERGAVRVRRQQHVRSQQDQAGDRNTAMPDCRLVDPVEPFLHPRQRADQHEADRQEQDRLGAQQLPDVARGGLPGGPRDDPEDGLGEDEDADDRRPDLAGDESPVHDGDPIAEQRGALRSRVQESRGGYTRDAPLRKRRTLTTTRAPAWASRTAIAHPNAARRTRY